MSLEFLHADPLSTPTRRGFLKTAAVAVLSLALPKFLTARSKSFWFLHTETGESWPVDDPVSWSLQNVKHPILERAREGLLKLTPADTVRIIRLLTRRCRLNLIEFQPNGVVVHYWGRDGQADLRPFFKQHGLARKNIQVTLIDRKREASFVQHGDDFLYGERLGQYFPVGLYMAKRRRRSVEEPNDWQVAPCSLSNYCWEGEGVKQCYIPWRVLKSAWRHENAPLCRNCDMPTLLTSFGYFSNGFYKREPIVTHVCSLCKRAFEDSSPWDGPEWIMQNLGKPLLPTCDMMFGKPVRYTLPWTAEGQAHDRNLRLVRYLGQIKSRGIYCYDVSGHIVLLTNNATIHLPPLDGNEHVENWCRRVKHLTPDEG